MSRIVAAAILSAGVASLPAIAYAQTTGEIPASTNYPLLLVGGVALVLAFYLGRFLGEGPSAIRGLSYLRSMYHEFAIMSFGAVILVEGKYRENSTEDKSRLARMIMRELSPGVMTADQVESLVFDTRALAERLFSAEWSNLRPVDYIGALIRVQDTESARVAAETHVRSESPK